MEHVILELFYSLVFLYIYKFNHPNYTADERPENMPYTRL